MSGFFESELFYLLVGGVVMLLIWIFVKKGRLPEEEPSVLERILMFGGIVVTITAVLILLFRADVLDKPGQEEEEDQPELSSYEREPSGCSKPKNKFKDFNNE